LFCLLRDDLVALSKKPRSYVNQTVGFVKKKEFEAIEKTNNKLDQIMVIKAFDWSNQFCDQHKITKNIQFKLLEQALKLFYMESEFVLIQF
jgi:hypothetical protein